MKDVKVDEVVEDTGANEAPAAPADTVVCMATLPPDAAETGTILVPAKKNGKSGTIVYAFGKNLKAMVELFGKDVVFSQALAQMKIKLQASMRAYLEAGKSPEELLGVWKPGVAMPKVAKDPAVATLNFFDNLSADEQAAMIAKLQERVGG